MRHRAFECATCSVILVLAGCGMDEREVYRNLLQALSASEADLEAALQGFDHAQEHARQEYPKPAPQTLLDVNADQVRFLHVNWHPLLLLPPGVTLDDPQTSLSGCWGRVSNEPRTAATVLPATVLEVLQFDVAAGTLVYHTVTDALGADLTQDGNPTIATYTSEIQFTSTNSFARNVVGTAGGTLNPNGQVAFSFLGTLVSEFALGQEWDTAVAIAGDVLLTDEGSIGASITGIPNRRVWIRIPCAGP